MSIYIRQKSRLNVGNSHRVKFIGGKTGSQRPKNKNGQVEVDKQHDISDCQCDVLFMDCERL